MNNQEYLDAMTPEQRRRSEIEGIAGIVSLFAGSIEREYIIVNPDTLNDDGKTFSFSYTVNESKGDNNGKESNQTNKETERQREWGAAIGEAIIRS